MSVCVYKPVSKTKPSANHFLEWAHFSVSGKPKTKTQDVTQINRRKIRSHFSHILTTGIFSRGTKEGPQGWTRSLCSMKPPRPLLLSWREASAPSCSPGRANTGFPAAEDPTLFCGHFICQPFPTCKPEWAGCFCWFSNLWKPRFVLHSPFQNSWVLMGKQRMEPSLLQWFRVPSGTVRKMWASSQQIPIHTMFHWNPISGIQGLPEAHRVGGDLQGSLV